MRLFISINFDQNTKDRFIKIQKSLIKMGKGRLTPPENLHLTLIFLGEVPDEKGSLLSDALKAVEVSPMELKVAQIGTFSEESGLWWAGIEGNRKLNDLQARISAVLSECGSKLGNDKYRPHITLVRDYIKGKDFNVKKALSRPFVIPVSSFSLMRSELNDKGAIYTELGRYTCSDT
jgi:2'-5' RNA ligase